MPEVQATPALLAKSSSAAPEVKSNVELAVRPSVVDVKAWLQTSGIQCAASHLHLGGAGDGIGRAERERGDSAATVS